MSLPTDKPKRSLLYKSWRIWETVSGIAVAIAFVSFGLIYVLTPEGTVVTASDLHVSLERVDDTKPPVYKVSYKGNLRYTLDVDRLQSCPGVVVYTFTQRVSGNSPANTVIFRRPVVIGRIGKQENAGINLPLPETVFPGDWIFSSSVESQCPRHIQIDPLTSFFIQVSKSPGQDSTMGG